MDKAMLFQRVESQSCLFGSFMLRSGRVSDTYFDKYQFESDPHTLRELAYHLNTILPTTEILAGLELGGVPLATALSLYTSIPAVFVRKVAKKYGTCKIVEGTLVQDKRVVVVEDIVTTGGQIVASVDAIRAAGGFVDCAVCVIERGAAAHDTLLKHGVVLRSLFQVGV